MLTRRQVIELGAVAGLAALLGHERSARAAANPTAADHLRREPWLPLVGGTFAVAGAALRLAEVGDLPRLVGRDDAFRLEFTGPVNALASGTHPFQHAALGSFVMFVSPVDIVVGTEQRYEVVVDRSVGPDAVPAANSTPRGRAPATARGPMNTGPAPAAPHHRRRKTTRLAHRHARRRRRKPWAPAGR